ncbi:FAD linked oxidase [gamma proteobacterium HdN1]|nr:FAD linked oxidase [gamma proteobacterium HdN1]
MQRSRWGWGYEGQLDALSGAVKRASQFFGQLQSAMPVADADLELPTPRTPIPAALSAFADASPLTRARFTWGKSYTDRVRGFYGDYSIAPDFVVQPTNDEQVHQVLDVCDRLQLAVIPFGGGSSVTGGVEARPSARQRGAVTMDLSRLDQLLEVDSVSLTARIQAGIFGPALEKQLATHGLTLRHFPQSFEFSTLGGWIVTRAGGHFATVYTHIDELVQSVRMLTPQGLLETPHLPASGAGPDGNRLICGSEGTFGVVLDAWMRVRPRPRFRAGASVHFKDYWQAVAATRAIAQSGLFPANCRLLDMREAFLNQVAADGSSVLVLGFESADHSMEAGLARALEITRDFGGVCPKGPSLREGEGGERGDDSGEQWRASFLSGPYLQDAMIQAGILADTFETACTWQAFPALYEGVTQAVQAALTEVCGGGVISCRFTHVYPDGPAPYFTFLGKAKRGGELEQWLAIKNAASEALGKFGGTITHHHAVGRMHKAGYAKECPPLLAESLRAVKQRLDPHGIMNPGVLLPGE